MVNKRLLFKSLIISIIYVGIGTLSLLSLYPQSPINTVIAWLGLLLTLPVTFIGFGIMYTEPDTLNSILLTQLILFFLFWFLTYLFLTIKRKLVE